MYKLEILVSGCWQPEPLAQPYSYDAAVAKGRWWCMCRPCVRAY